MGRPLSETAPTKKENVFEDSNKHSIKVELVVKFFKFVDLRGR